MSVLSWLQVVAVILILGAVICPNITAFFNSDDLDQIYYVRTSGPLGMWIHTPTDYFRPLFSIVLWIEWHCWRLNSSGYHADRLVLHGCCAALLYAVGRRFNLEGRVCLAASALFLVLPGHSEAVAWIADLGDLLVTVFGLLLIVVYFHARSSGKPWYFVLCTLLLLLAFISKEAGITLPFVLIVVDRFFLFPASKRWHPYPFLSCLLLPFYFLARKAYCGSFFGGPMGQAKVVPLSALAGIFRALPVTLSPIASSPVLCITIACVMSLLVGVLFLRAPLEVRRTGGILLGLFFVIGLPGFWTTYSPAVWGYDTRILYPASVFGCLFLALVLRQLTWSGSVVRILFLIFALQSFQIFARWHQAGNWVRQGLVDLAPFATKDSHLIALTNPDMRYPAYVFRRGLGDGLALLYDTPPVNVSAPEAVTYYSDADTVTVEPRSGGCVVTIHYAARPIRRTSVWAIDPSSATTTLLAAEPFSYFFALPELHGEDHIVYFSAGRFHEWKPPAAGPAR